MSKVLEQEVSVDYPQEGEKITHPQYTMRVGAADVQKVVVSIDDSPWQPCRQAGGFWWYDWSNFMSGRHEVEVKALTKDGRTMTSEVRRFKVELDRAL